MSGCCSVQWFVFMTKARQMPDAPLASRWAGAIFNHFFSPARAVVLTYYVSGKALVCRHLCRQRQNLDCQRWLETLCRQEVFRQGFAGAKGSLCVFLPATTSWSQMLKMNAIWMARIARYTSVRAENERRLNDVNRAFLIFLS